MDRHSITVNSQYNPIRKSEIVPSLGNAVKNIVQDQKGLPSFGKSGPQGGGIFLGLIQDAYKGITNFILKEQAEDLQKALLDEEVKARAKINVLAGKD